MFVVYHCKEYKPIEEIKEFFMAPCVSSVTFSGKLFPSGYISVGRVKKSSRLLDGERYEHQRARYDYYQRRSWHYQKGMLIESKAREISPSPLGLSSVSNHHKSREVVRYGLKGITPNGRRRVREGAFLLEQRYGRRLGFYTLTCPYTDAQSIYSYNQDISYIQRSFFQEVSRAYQRKGVAWTYVSVLEIQTKRYVRDGVPVLHIHYIAPCYMPGTSEWVLSAGEIRALWGRVLCSCIGASPQMGASIDASVVYSSAVGYISKYMSKGAAEVAYLAEICPGQLPSQWWSMSCNLRRCIKRCTVSIPQGLCETLMYGGSGIFGCPIVFSYVHQISISFAGQELCVGASAFVTFGQTPLLRDPTLIEQALEELLI